MSQPSRPETPPAPAASPPAPAWGLVWPGRDTARARAATPPAGRLRTCADRGVAADTSAHRLLLGDNLDALKLLRDELAGRVDLIYIDPPYNTAVDLVYRSSYRGARDDADAGLHAAWLSMMLPRLLLARELLGARGAIAVSIDHNESHNLRHLLDEVFGPAQHIAEIAVSLNPKGRQLTRFFATSHEYLQIYARDRERCALDAGCAAAVDAADFPHTDDRGPYRLLPLRNTNKKFDPTTRPNLHYPLYVDRTSGAVSTTAAAGHHIVLPVFGDGQPAVWRWSRDKAAAQCAELLGREVNGRRGGRWDVFQKDYLGETRTKKLRSVWLADEVGSTDRARTELKQLLGVPFDAPKPLALLRRIVRTMPRDALVLDFFAGSGTTGHAVLEQNLADGGTRRFVLCQLPAALDPRERSQRVAAAWCDRRGLPRDLTELTHARLAAACAALRAAHPTTDADLGFRVERIVAD